MMNKSIGRMHLSGLTVCTALAMVLQSGEARSNLLIPDAAPGDTARVSTSRDIADDAAVVPADNPEGRAEDVPRSLVFRTDVPDTSAKDSSAFEPFGPAAKPMLLPEHMSFVERGLWGENGFLRNIGIASPLTPEVREHELAVRRTMLTMHQIGGFLSLGSMIATAYFGQKYLDHGQRKDRDLHQTFIATTIPLYSATALLAVLSPPPLIRRDETSTTTIHKTLAWVHVAGMIATPLLGLAINRRGTSYYKQARLHQISGYITTAVFAASLIVVTF